MKHILRCKNCGNYTLNGLCPKCGHEATTPMPPKYSPDDKYGMYRRKVKFQSLKSGGLI